MSGAIGAVSNKFILVAATLLLPLRVGQERVHGAIDAAIPISEISPQLAARFHLSDGMTPSKPAVVRLRRPLNIGIGGENFDIDAIEVGGLSPAMDRDFVIGQDILAAHVFELDFAHRTIRLLLPSEYRGATRRLQAIQLFKRADGSRELSLRVGTLPEISALLDLASDSTLKIDRAFIAANPSYRVGAHEPVRSGEAVLGPLDITADNGERRTAPAVIGMEAFRGSRIILDLPHNRIWMAR
jgi:hypothetical protein